VSVSAAPSTPIRDRSGLLRRLAVFVDGFTLEAAEAIASGAVDAPGSALWGAVADHLPPGRPTAEIVDALQVLTRQGLLLRGEGPGATFRYRLPGPVRARALKELVSTGALSAARRAHSTYFLAFAEAIDRLVWTPQYQHWMERLEAEAGNLEAALSWADEAGESALGLRLATALWLFWQTRGRVATGRDWLERMLAHDGPSSRSRAAGLSVAGLLAWLQDDLAPAAAMLDEAADRWRDLAFPQGLGRALFARALVAWRDGDGARQSALIGEALGLFRETNDLAGQPLCLIVLGIAARAAGEHGRALALLEEAVGLCDHGGFVWGTAAARYYEGEVRTDLGDYAGAGAAYRASIASSWALGDPWTTGAGIGGLATVAALRGDTNTAGRLFGAADARSRGAGAFLPVVDRTVHARVVAAARATLGVEVFAAAFDAGTALTLDEAIAAATAVSDEILAGTGSAPGMTTGTAAPAHLGPTPREMDVLRLLVEGCSDAEIATALRLSPRTVSEYVGHLLKKSGRPTRTALAVYVVRGGLV
jgi:DNA-binding CsgD family transcriptional regulator/tetratricopeptide (TPR) repeat protein